MVKVRKASAVILTRGQGQELEVFLVERSPELRFFGGYWAFPGGVLEGVDHRRGDESEESSFQRCALRELFEEVGVLLSPLRERVPAVARAALRQELLSGRVEGGEWAKLAELVDRARGGARRFSRITTPPFVPVRYRTIFFHIELPAGEIPDVHLGELVQGEFLRPAEALREWREGERLIAPPVLFLLELLGDEIEQGRGLAGFLTRAERECLQLESGRLHDVRFSPGIFMAPLETPTLPPATTTNCLLVGTRQVFVVDPATYEETEQLRLFDLLERWRAAGREVAGVLLTHHHQDHIGAVNQVSCRYDVPVLAHPRTLARIPTGHRGGQDLVEGDRIDLGVAPDGSGDWHLEVLHTPGHDRGHLVFLESRYQAAIVGDMVSTISTIVIDPPEGHLATYLASLRRLSERPLRMLYPAHGPAHRDGVAVLRHFLSHRAQREAKLVQALEQGPAPESELVRKVYDDVAEELHPLALRSLCAGLEKLEEEGRARRRDDLWRLQ